MRKQIGIFCVAITLFPPVALTQSRNNPVAEHWVSTWATAQQLVRPVPGGGRGAAQSQAGPQAAGQQQSAVVPNRPQGVPQPTPGRGRGGPQSNIPATLSDQTIRMVVHTSIGGRHVRVQISNAIGTTELTIGSAHIAVRAKESEIVAGTDRVLTFSGRPACTIQPGVLIFSDPVDLDVAPATDLAVSLYFPNDTGPPTSHTVALHTSYISKGDTAGQPLMPDASATYAYLWLSSVDVVAPPNVFVIVAYGDSITDGYATTRDADRAWPTLLAKRLMASKAAPRAAVINLGISGNQVLRDGAGQSALARFDRDVLSHPGVRWMIVLEGINDINIRGRNPGPEAVTAEDLIAGYRQLIERAHSQGIRVIGATIMPEEGLPTASERGEEIRSSVNAWIRTSGAFDATVDFDKVVRDPEHPIKLRADFDPGDHIHPNDTGNQAMADAFDLAIFKK
jgi:lysophospholipase L1-like esterase